MTANTTTASAAINSAPITSATTNNTDIVGIDSMSNAATVPNRSMPQRINLDKWEDIGYSWSGQVTPKELPRVAALVPEAYLEAPINLNIKLGKSGQMLNLDLDFEGDIWATCQRCLQPLQTDVTHDTELLLLLNENQQSLVDDSDDYILLDELIDSSNTKNNKPGERFLPLLRLVEDELLLDLPLSAKHDDCEMAVVQVGEIVEEEVDNPFAALEALKGKL